MKSKVARAEEIFAEKLDGRGTTDVICEVFRANGLFGL